MSVQKIVNYIINYLKLNKIMIGKSGRGREAKHVIVVSRSVVRIFTLDVGSFFIIFIYVRSWVRSLVTL